MRVLYSTSDKGKSTKCAGRRTESGDLFGDVGVQSKIIVAVLT